MILERGIVTLDVSDNENRVIGNIGRYGGASGTFWKDVGREREEKLNYEWYFVN